MSVLFGLLLNRLYPLLELSPRALSGSATELLPGWVQLTASAILLALGAMVLAQRLARRWRSANRSEDTASCGCGVEEAQAPR